MTPEALSGLHRKCFDSPRPWTAREFADLLASDKVHLHLQDNGFLLGRSIADEAEILTLAVDPSARRKGIATQLLGAFETEVIARRGAVAFLEVAATNAAAIALYENAGYSRSGLRPAYYAGIDALILHKQLTP